MLFIKKIQRSCAYCQFSVRLDDEQYLCTKRGLRTEADSCRKFRYDPLKRIPKKVKPVDFSKYETDDFSL